MRRFTYQPVRQSLLFLLCLFVLTHALHAAELPSEYTDDNPDAYTQETEYSSEDDAYADDSAYDDTRDDEIYEYNEEDIDDGSDADLDAIIPPALPTAEGIDAMIAPIQLRINQKDIDGRRAEYPLLFYNNITYIPLTFNLCRALGLESTYDAVYGLKIVPSASIPLERLQQDLLPQEAEDQVLGDPAPSTRVVRAVYLAGQEIDNSKQEYPLILFRDITYLPLTWNFIHDILHIDYVFDNHQKLLELVRPLPYTSIPERQLPQILLASRTKLTGTPLSTTTLVYEGSKLVERSIERYQPNTRLVWQSTYDMVYQTETHLLSISPQQYVWEAAYAPTATTTDATYSSDAPKVTSSAYEETSEDTVTSVVYAEEPTGVVPAVYEEDISSTVTTSTYDTEIPSVTPIVYEEIIVASPSTATYETALPSTTSSTYQAPSSTTTGSTYGSTSSTTSSTYGSTTPSTTNVVYTSENGVDWQRSATATAYLPQPPVVPQFELINPVEGWKVQCEDSLWFFELDHMTLTPGKNGQSVVSLYTYRFDIGTWSLIRVTQTEYTTIDGVIQTSAALKRTVIDVEYGYSTGVPLP